MPARKRPDLKTANGQFEAVHSIFERDDIVPRSVVKEVFGVKEKRRNPGDLAHDKVWMRSQIKHELEQHYFRELCTGIFTSDEVKVFLRKKFDPKKPFEKVNRLVKLRAQNEFKSINPEALEKARKQLVGVMREIIKRNNLIARAQKDLALRVGEFPQDGSRRSLAFYNAIDAYAHISSSGQKAELVLGKLEKIRFKK